MYQNSLKLNKNGINYFQGSNDTGKTEFYEFLDHMLWRSEQLDLSKEWYEHLSKAILIFKYNKISYAITRTKKSRILFLV